MTFTSMTGLLRTRPYAALCLDYLCCFQMDGIPPDHGQLRMFPCCPLPKIPFQCPGGPTEPLRPPISLHPQEDQAAGGTSRVSVGDLGMEVKIGTLSLLLYMCLYAMDTPQKDQNAVAILWLRLTHSYMFRFWLPYCSISKR